MCAGSEANCFMAGLIELQRDMKRHGEIKEGIRRDVGRGVNA